MTNKTDLKQRRRALIGQINKKPLMLNSQAELSNKEVFFDFAAGKKNANTSPVKLSTLQTQQTTQTQSTTQIQSTQTTHQQQRTVTEEQYRKTSGLIDYEEHMRRCEREKIVDGKEIWQNAFGNSEHGPIKVDQKSYDLLMSREVLNYGIDHKFIPTGFKYDVFETGDRQLVFDMNREEKEVDTDSMVRHEDLSALRKREVILSNQPLAKEELRILNWGEKQAQNIQYHLFGDGVPTENEKEEIDITREYLKKLTPIFNELNASNIPWNAVDFLMDEGKNAEALLEFMESKKYSQHEKELFKTFFIEHEKNRNGNKVSPYAANVVGCLKAFKSFLQESKQHGLEVLPNQVNFEEFFKQNKGFNLISWCGFQKDILRLVNKPFLDLQWNNSFKINTPAAAYAIDKFNYKVVTPEHELLYGEDDLLGYAGQEKDSHLPFADGSRYLEKNACWQQAMFEKNMARLNARYVQSTDPKTYEEVSISFKEKLDKLLPDTEPFTKDSKTRAYLTRQMLSFLWATRLQHGLPVRREDISNLVHVLTEEKQDSTRLMAFFTLTDMLLNPNQSIIDPTAINFDQENLKNLINLYQKNLMNPYQVTIENQKKPYIIEAKPGTLSDYKGGVFYLSAIQVGKEILIQYEIKGSDNQSIEKGIYKPRDYSTGSEKKFKDLSEANRFIKDLLAEQKEVGNARTLDDYKKSKKIVSDRYSSAGCESYDNYRRELDRIVTQAHQNGYLYSKDKPKPSGSDLPLYTPTTSVSYSYDFHDLENMLLNIESFYTQKKDELPSKEGGVISDYKKYKIPGYFELRHLLLHKANQALGYETLKIAFSVEDKKLTEEIDQLKKEKIGTVIPYKDGEEPRPQRGEIIVDYLTSSHEGRLQWAKEEPNPRIFLLRYLDQDGNPVKKIVHANMFHYRPPRDIKEEDRDDYLLRTLAVLHDESVFSVAPPFKLSDYPFEKDRKEGRPYSNESESQGLDRTNIVDSGIFEHPHYDPARKPDILASSIAGKGIKSKPLDVDLIASISSKTRLSGQEQQSLVSRLEDLQNKTLAHRHELLTLIASKNPLETSSRVLDYLSRPENQNAPVKKEIVFFILSYLNTLKIDDETYNRLIKTSVDLLQENSDETLFFERFSQELESIKSIDIKFTPKVFLDSFKNKAEYESITSTNQAQFYQAVVKEFNKDTKENKEILMGFLPRLKKGMISETDGNFFAKRLIKALNESKERKPIIFNLINQFRSAKNHPNILCDVLPTMIEMLNVTPNFPMELLETCLENDFLPQPFANQDQVLKNLKSMTSRLSELANESPFSVLSLKEKKTVFKMALALTAQGEAVNTVLEKVGKVIGKTPSYLVPSTVRAVQSFFVNVYEQSPEKLNDYLKLVDKIFALQTTKDAQLSENVSLDKLFNFMASNKEIEMPNASQLDVAWLERFFILSKANPPSGEYGVLSQQLESLQNTLPKDEWDKLLMVYRDSPIYPDAKRLGELSSSPTPAKDFYKQPRSKTTLKFPSLETPEALLMFNKAVNAVKVQRAKEGEVAMPESLDSEKKQAILKNFILLQKYWPDYKGKTFDEVQKEINGLASRPLGAEPPTHLLLMMLAMKAVYMSEFEPNPIQVLVLLQQALYPQEEKFNIPMGDGKSATEVQLAIYSYLAALEKGEQRDVFITSLAFLSARDAIKWPRAAEFVGIKTTSMETISAEAQLGIESTDPNPRLIFGDVDTVSLCVYQKMQRMMETGNNQLEGRRTIVEFNDEIDASLTSPTSLRIGAGGADADRIPFSIQKEMLRYLQKNVFLKEEKPLNLIALLNNLIETEKRDIPEQLYQQLRTLRNYLGESKEHNFSVKSAKDRLKEPSASQEELEQKIFDLKFAMYLQGCFETRSYQDTIEFKVFSDSSMLEDQYRIDYVSQTQGGQRLSKSTAFSSDQQRALEARVALQFDEENHNQKEHLKTIELKPMQSVYGSVHADPSLCADYVCGFSGTVERLSHYGYGSHFEDKPINKMPRAQDKKLEVTYHFHKQSEGYMEGMLRQHVGKNPILIVSENDIAAQKTADEYSKKLPNRTPIKINSLEELEPYLKNYTQYIFFNEGSGTSPDELAAILDKVAGKKGAIFVAPSAKRGIDIKADKLIALYDGTPARGITSKASEQQTKGRAGRAGHEGEAHSYVNVDQLNEMFKGDSDPFEANQDLLNKIPSHLKEDVKKLFSKTGWKAFYDGFSDNTEQAITKNATNDAEDIARLAYHRLYRRLAGKKQMPSAEERAKQDFITKYSYRYFLIGGYPPNALNDMAVRKAFMQQWQTALSELLETDPGEFKEDELLKRYDVLRQIDKYYTPGALERKKQDITREYQAKYDRIDHKKRAEVGAINFDPSRLFKNFKGKNEKDLNEFIEASEIFKKIDAAINKLAGDEEKLKDKLIKETMIEAVQNAYKEIGTEKIPNNIEKISLLLKTDEKLQDTLINVIIDTPAPLFSALSDVSDFSPAKKTLYSYLKEVVRSGKSFDKKALSPIDLWAELYNLKDSNEQKLRAPNLSSDEKNILEDLATETHELIRLFCENDVYTQAILDSKNVSEDQKISFLVTLFEYRKKSLPVFEKEKLVLVSERIILSTINESQKEELITNLFQRMDAKQILSLLDSKKFDNKQQKLLVGILLKWMATLPSSKREADISEIGQKLLEMKIPEANLLDLVKNTSLDLFKLFIPVFLKVYPKQITELLEKIKSVEGDNTILLQTLLQHTASKDQIILLLQQYLPLKIGKNSEIRQWDACLLRINNPKLTEEFNRFNEILGKLDQNRDKIGQVNFDNKNSETLNAKNKEIEALIEVVDADFEQLHTVLSLDQTKLLKDSWEKEKKAYHKKFSTIMSEQLLIEGSKTLNEFNIETSGIQQAISLYGDSKKLVSSIKKKIDIDLIPAYPAYEDATTEFRNKLIENLLSRINKLITSTSEDEIKRVSEYVELINTVGKNKIILDLTQEVLGLEVKNEEQAKRKLNIECFLLDALSAKKQGNELTNELKKEKLKAAEFLMTTYITNDLEKDYLQLREELKKYNELPQSQKPEEQEFIQNINDTLTLLGLSEDTEKWKNNVIQVLKNPDEIRTKLEENFKKIDSFCNKKTDKESSKLAKGLKYLAAVIILAALLVAAVVLFHISFLAVLPKLVSKLTPGNPLAGVGVLSGIGFLVGLFGKGQEKASEAKAIRAEKFKQLGKMVSSINEKHQHIESKTKDISHDSTTDFQALKQELKTIKKGFQDKKELEAKKKDELGKDDAGSLTNTQ